TASSRLRGNVSGGDEEVRQPGVRTLRVVLRDLGLPLDEADGSAFELVRAIEQHVDTGASGKQEARDRGTEDVTRSTLVLEVHGAPGRLGANVCGELRKGFLKMLRRAAILLERDSVVRHAEHDDPETACEFQSRGDRTQAGQSPELLQYQAEQDRDGKAPDVVIAGDTGRRRGRDAE